MSRRIVVVLMGVMALALLIASCGDSSDGSDGDSESAVSKPVFVKQADAICENLNKQYVQDYKQFAKANEIENFPSSDQGVEISEQIYIPLVEQRVTALRELDPPSGDEERVEAILIATEDGVAVAHKDMTAVTQSSTNIFAKSLKLSRDYGFKVCGR